MQFAADGRGAADAGLLRIQRGCPPEYSRTIDLMPGWRTIRSSASKKAQRFSYRETTDAVSAAKLVLRRLRRTRREVAFPDLRRKSTGGLFENRNFLFHNDDVPV